MYLLRLLRPNRFNKIGHIRCLCDSKSKNDGDSPFTLPADHPIARTGRLLKGDMKKVKNFFLPERKIIGNTEADIRDIRSKINDNEFQSHCDIVVIGGGGVGASIAYWLKKRGGDGINVVVLEKDPTVSRFYWIFELTFTKLYFLI